MAIFHGKRLHRALFPPDGKDVAVIGIIAPDHALPGIEALEGGRPETVRRQSAAVDDSDQFR